MPSPAPRSPARNSAGSSSPPAPNAAKANGIRYVSSRHETNPSSTRTSPPKQSLPTAASSPTGNQAASRARVPHRGAHLVGHQTAKQRGRRQPQLLRFSSRSPAPTRTLAKEPPPVQRLDLHP